MPARLQQRLAISPQLPVTLFAPLAISKPSPVMYLLIMAILLLRQQRRVSLFLAQQESLLVPVYQLVVLRLTLAISIYAQMLLQLQNVFILQPALGCLLT